MLLRFLREHRSEWADSGIDAYSVAAVKSGPCSVPVSRVGCFGGQVILPLAHTIENEEVCVFYIYLCVGFMFVFFRRSLLDARFSFLVSFIVHGGD